MFVAAWQCYYKCVVMHGSCTISQSHIQRKMNGFDQ